MFGQANTPLAEFSDHTSEVTGVALSKTGARAFSCSLDKTFRVYDLANRCTLKTIQAPSPITRMAVDSTETMVYLACDNQNVYGYSLDSAVQGERQKRTLQHK